MATDLEKLVVQLDADLKKFENSMNRANGIAQRQFKAIEKQAVATEKKLSSVFDDLGKNFVIGFAAVGSLKGFQDLIDASTRVQNALKVAGLSGTDLTKVYDQLFASAQKNAAPIESIVQLYSRMSLVQKDLGASSSDLIKFTDDIGKALRVGGVSAEQASGALLQLSQALGSGTVHAEEFNSIVEGATPIAQAAAAGIEAAGGSVSKLKQLVIDGKVSSQDFFRAVLEGSKILDSRLKGSVLTVDQELTKLHNTMLKTAGQLNEITGASQYAIAALDRLGSYVEALGNLMDKASNSSLGKYVGWLKKINDTLGSLPGINPLASLPSAKDIEDFGNLFTSAPADKIADLKKAQADLADVLERTSQLRGSLDTDAEQKQIADLVAGLRDGSKTAEDAGKVLDNLGPKFARMSGAMQPWIDTLKKATDAVKAYNEEQSKTADTSALNPRPASEGAQEAQRKADADAFLKQQIALESRTKAEKELADLTAKFLKDAKEAGKNITEAEAAAAARLSLEKKAQDELSSKSASSAVDLIKGFESFRSGAYFDVNHYRAGYGSDTTTSPEGKVSTVTSATTVTLADADRDLLRRVGETQASIESKIGTDTFNAMDSNQQAALTSIAYNYGTLPDRIVAAIKTGDAGTVYQAIKALGTDNGGINQGRRDQEAQLYLNGAPDAIQKRVSSQDDFAKTMKDQQQQLAALKEETGIRASLNPLINDYGQKLSEVQKAQELFTTAQQEGTAAGKELISAQQLLNGDLSSLSPEAQKQAEAMRALATEYGNTTAASNRLQDSQEKLKASAESFANDAKDVVGGAVSDIRTAMEDGKITAKEWADILVNALNKIADKLQDALLDQLFQPGNFGGLFGLLGGGTTGGSVGSGIAGAAKLPVSNAALERHIKALDSVTAIRPADLRMPALPRTDGIAAGRVHVTVGLKKDGLNIEPEVVGIARGEAGRAAGTVQTTFDRWRANGFHTDWEAHANRRRVKGVI
jgi:tape measure domain-containing protein